MATSGGPKIKTDGLVFGLDTGYPLVSNNDDSYKFNKGEPTYNWIDFQNAVAQSSYTAWTGPNSGNWVANHPDAIQVVNKLGNSITGYYNSGVTDAANTHHAHWIYDNELKRPVVQMRDLDAQWKAKNFNTGKTPTEMGLAHGGSYTISWLQWSDTVGKGADAGLYGSSPSGFHDGRSYSTTTQTVANTWERKSYTESALSTNFNTGSNVSIYMYGHTTPPNTSGIIRIADVQLEINSHSTPLASPNRSVSGSLIDLTKTTDIDLSNVSFDSTAQMAFDGTDDSILLTPRVQYSTGSAWTAELIFEPTTTDSWNPLFGGYLNAGGYWMFHGGQNLTYYEGSSTESGTRISYKSWSIGNTFTLNQDHHLTIAYTPTTAGSGSFALYYNGGEKVDTFDYGFYWANSLDMRTIGSGDSSRYGTNNIKIFKFYNIDLTASEIKTNYNAIKSRFGLT